MVEDTEETEGIEVATEATEVVEGTEVVIEVEGATEGIEVVTEVEGATEGAKGEIMENSLKELKVDSMLAEAKLEPKRTQNLSKMQAMSEYEYDLLI